MQLAPSTDLEIRQRRALWRAKHRGTKELDYILGCYAEKKVFTMETQELEMFEGFLALSETELQNHLMDLSVDEGFQYLNIIRDIRKYHGL